MSRLRQGFGGPVPQPSEASAQEGGSLHRVSTHSFLRALAPRDSRGRGGRAASLLVGTQTYLAAHRGRVVSSAELISWIYAEEPEGGPLDAMDCLRTTMSRLRKRGVPVVTIGHRGYSL
jgi:hypothetical protein